MVSKTISIGQFTNMVIQNPGTFFEKVKEYDCEIIFKHRNIIGNVNSVLSVLDACASDGDDITIECDGKDEKAALKMVIEILEHGN